MDRFSELNQQESLFIDHRDPAVVKELSETAFDTWDVLLSSPLPRYSADP